jgi:peptidyl-prolyl cis-trans isomerase SurA
MSAFGASAASSIRIKVDDQPITSYDISQRATLLKLTGGGGEKAAIEDLLPLHTTLGLQSVLRG